MYIYIYIYRMNVFVTSDLSDGTHGLGPAFSEDESLVRVKVLGGLDEAEVYGGFVPRP